MFLHIEFPVALIHSFARKIISQFKNPDAEVKPVLHTYILPYIFNREGGVYYTHPSLPIAMK
jgi:hypothetical protein